MAEAEVEVNGVETSQSEASKEEDPLKDTEAETKTEVAEVETAESEETESARAEPAGAEPKETERSEPAGSATPADEASKTEGQGTPSKVSGKAFSEQFKAFSKFGDSKSDGRLLSLSQSDKWMKQAKVIDGKTITTTDTGIHFKKLKSIKVGETEYKKFLDDLSKTRKVDVEEIKKKLVNCGTPGLTSNAVGGKTPSAVERLTDTSRYTGSHKQRFDETGKGRGIAGRKDLPDKSGYVRGYQNKDSYSKTHPTQ